MPLPLEAGNGEGFGAGSCFLAAAAGSGFLAAGGAEMFDFFAPTGTPLVGFFDAGRAFLAGL